MCAPVERPIQLRCISLIGLGPVQRVQVVQQPVAVGGDPHHPLLQAALEHREVAAVGATVGGDLLVGQHGTQAGAPVDRRLRHVGQAVVVDDRAALDVGQRGPGPTVRGGPLAGLELGDQLLDRSRLAPPAVGLPVEPRVEDLQEDPLGPPVVADVRGGQRTAARRRPDPAGAAGSGTGRRSPRWSCADGYRSAPRTARRAARTRRSPSGAGRCTRSSGGTACSSRYRCSPAGARRAAPPRTGTGTCPARTASALPRADASGSASGPTGLGAWKVPCSSQ